MLIVNCGSNKLAALDLSGLEKLTSLGCYNNNLTTLDTSKLPEMSFLECYANSLTTLDLTTNSKIATLHCQNNLLKTLKIETCQILHRSIAAKIAWKENSTSRAGQNSERLIVAILF